jgi:hypothetical protein
VNRRSFFATIASAIVGPPTAKALPTGRLFNPTSNVAADWDAAAARMPLVFHPASFVSNGGPWRIEWSVPRDACWLPITADAPSSELATRSERRAGWTYAAARKPARFEPWP